MSTFSDTLRRLLGPGRAPALPAEPATDLVLPAEPATVLVLPAEPATDLVLPAEPATVPAPLPAEAASGPFQGYVDAASHRHVAGWVRDLARPGERIPYRVVATLAGVETVLHTGVADEHTAQLSAIGVGDGRHAFHARFDRRLDDAERDSLAVQVVATGQPLELAPAIERTWTPIKYVALDIVDNCNLRCPFCLFDYDGVNRTNSMRPEHFEAALKFAPLTSDGNFWLSCLHEPTLHPQFEALLAMIPAGQRRKIFYTTNLAKRMPQSYYELLASSGLHNLNISVESFDPALYERMRKGARHRIFSANWDIMLDAFARGTAPPKLRYIIMAYKSNLAELPTLVRRLRDEKQAWQVELRFTYPEPHISADFAKAEFLDEGEWAWLRAQMAAYSPADVILIEPPPATAPGPAAAAAPVPTVAPAPTAPPDKPRQVYLRITQDGVIHVNTGGDDDPASGQPARRVADAHVSEIADADAFLAGLLA